MKPAPLLTNKEIKYYLPAFYARRWGISIREVERPNGPNQKVPQLTTTFRYGRYSNLADAVQAITRIAEDEKVRLSVS